MQVYPNAKINIGLNILSKREDGFHEIESVMYPINLRDVLEVKSLSGSTNVKNSFVNSGIFINNPSEDNLVSKAYSILARDYNLPFVDIHLHKVIPFGAGLGGGSSDASFMLKLLNEKFLLGIGSERLKDYSSIIGSDCPFFIDNFPVIASGRGEVLEIIKISLKGNYLVLVVPDIIVGTKEAYSKVHPQIPKESLIELVSQPISNWKFKIKNDFEESVFSLYPEIAEIKNTLYNIGAKYASLSGSGSSVYGIFSERPDIPSGLRDYFIYEEVL